MGRKTKMEMYKRRIRIKKLYLQGKNVVDIADKEGIAVSTVHSDLKLISEEYMKAVQNNPNVVEKTQEHILKHLDELKMVKEKLWEIESTADSDKARIAALKGVLEELSHEARVLKLIDISKTINQYIRIDKMAIVVNQAIEVIKEFVPIEKQKYALQRLKGAKDKLLEDNEKGK